MKFLDFALTLYLADRVPSPKGFDEDSVGLSDYVWKISLVEFKEENPETGSVGPF